MAAAAHASTVLVTPAKLANADEVGDCVATNVDKNPITVTVAALDPATGSDVGVVNQCPGPVAAGESCQVLAKTGSGVYCRSVASSPRIRASLSVFGPNGFVAAIPATK